MEMIVKDEIPSPYKSPWVVSLSSFLATAI
jgi:hypothetical protein